MSDVNAQVKTCTKCDQPKPLSEFYARRNVCKVCVRAKMRAHSSQPETRVKRREYEAENREQITANQREKRATQPEVRDRHRAASAAIYAGYCDAVFGHYGRQCACCGSEDDISIDHVNGGGEEHRNQLGGSVALYRWLIANDFPAGYQTLCRRCNSSKWTGTTCRLHQKVLA